MRRQPYCARTPNTHQLIGGEETMMKPISVWGWLGGHDGQRPVGGFSQDARVTPLLFSKDILGFLMTTESQELGLASHLKYDLHCAMTKTIKQFFNSTLAVYFGPTHWQRTNATVCDTNVKYVLFSHLHPWEWTHNLFGQQLLQDPPLHRCQEEDGAGTYPWTAKMVIMMTRGSFKKVIGE